MRILLAFAIFAGGIVVVESPADAAKKYKRSVERRHLGDRPNSAVASPQRYSREAVECERARHADPSGIYSGFPCWAQEAFSPRGDQSRD